MKKIITREREMEKKASQIKEKLSAYIDAYGEITERIKELEKKKEEIKNLIIKYLGEGVHEGKKFNISVEKEERMKLDPGKILEAIGLENFLTVVSVSNEKVKAFIPAFSLPEYVKEKTEYYKVVARRK